MVLYTSKVIWHQVSIWSLQMAFLEIRLVLPYKKHCQIVIFWSFCISFENEAGKACGCGSIVFPAPLTTTTGNCLHSKQVFYLGENKTAISTVFEHVLLSDSKTQSQSDTWRRNFQALAFRNDQVFACGHRGS